MDTQVCIVGGAYTGVNTDLKVWEGRCINRQLQYTECFLKTEVLIFNVGPISAVQQGDSVIHTYIYSFFNILFHYGLSKDIYYSSLCYTSGVPKPQAMDHWYRSVAC